MHSRGSSAKYQVLESSSLKCCIVGDTKSGKTALSYRMQAQEFRADYSATSFDNYSVTSLVDGTPYHLSLFDTAGNHDMVQLRSLSYDKSDVVLVCFSLADPLMFVNVEKFWVNEIRSFLPHTPFLLVGTHLDLRDQRSSTAGENLVVSDIVIPRTRVADMATRLGTAGYVECSSKTGEGIEELIKELVVAAHFRPKENTSNDCCCSVM
ncbi:cell division control protein 42 homolog [Saccostrea cucullata]|uniref:cell division control protein 42 homolog n=1 Tax=Saccostrea cuccullata TaxID=36930 RepID=UPI002ED0F5E0